MASAALLVAVVSLAVGGIGVRPAGAAPAIRVSPSGNLDPAGAFVVVSGSGFQPNTQLFVMQCRSTSAQDHTCNSVGLRKVTTDASGAFTANAMKVVANFGATNCLQVPCAIKTSAVADHATDRSEDRSANISFRAPAPPATTAPPVTVAPTAPPQTTAPTTAPPATVTTTQPDASSTTTTAHDEAATTTTTPPGKRAAADDESDVEPEGEGDAEDASATAAETAASTEQISTDRSDGEGSSPLVPIVVVVAVAAAGVAGFVLIQRRKAAPDAGTPS